MNKFIAKLIPISLLILFILIMNSGLFLSKHLASAQQLSNQLNNLEKNIINDNWSLAQQQLAKSQKLWNSTSFWIHFSSTLNKLEQTNINLVQLKVALKTEDKKLALSILAELQQRWHYLIN
ncbi:MAG: DUF4363 family protein [Bacillota bacterium]